MVCTVRCGLAQLQTDNRIAHEQPLYVGPTPYSYHAFSMHSRLGIGADFHRAMIATAPGEKRLIGRRPMRNWTQLQFFSLFHCELRVIICHDLQSAVTKPTVPSVPTYF